MPDKNETAQRLAEAHFSLDEGVARIFRVVEADEDKPSTPVKLLEVNPETIEVGIEPVGFGPDPSRGVFFPSVVIEISPAEFERLRSGELSLPDGWRLDHEIERPAPAMAEGA